MVIISRQLSSWNKDVHYGLGQGLKRYNIFLNEAFENWRCQFGTYNSEKKGLFSLQLSKNLRWLQIVTTFLG